MPASKPAPPVQHDVSLKPFNTLALQSIARNFYQAGSEEQLRQAIEYFAARQIQPLVLGEGSNVVLASEQFQHCLHVASKGIELVEQSADHVLLRVAAGENWDDTVRYCLAQGYYGLENLALIPGSVGAAPVQNIGAYGVELDQFVQAVNVYHLRDASRQRLSREECQFAYRDSVFKNALKGRVVISSVELGLARQPGLNLSYPALAEELQAESCVDAHAVMAAVVRIRQRKLPDPKQTPNVGSFFKNPLVTGQKLKALQARFPSIVYFQTARADQFKLAAGWLLEQAGWKGRAEGPLAMHAEQALVLLNQNNASASQVIEIVDNIKASIRQKFDVDLSVEPTIY